MSADLHMVLISAHRANINRYRKILGSYLTPHERLFVEQRIAEEAAALEQLNSGAAHPTDVYAQHRSDRTERRLGVQGDERLISQKRMQAPFGCDLQLSVIENAQVYALAFPCRRTDGGWAQASTGTPVPINPTHWREWSD